MYFLYIIKIHNTIYGVKMSRKPNCFTQHILGALKSVGYSDNAAKMIAYGQTEMKILPKAIEMSKNPWYISPILWEDLYKKSNSSQSSQ